MQLHNNYVFHRTCVSLLHRQIVVDMFVKTTGHTQCTEPQREVHTRGTRDHKSPKHSSLNRTFNNKTTTFCKEKQVLGFHNNINW